jgi:steroid delta-isomerase-like uncharacterized protein
VCRLNILNNAAAAWGYSITVNKRGNKMGVEENKACVRRYVEEALNKGNMAVVYECLSPDWVYRGPFGEYKGPEAFIQIIAMMRKAFPDLHYTFDDIIAEGDRAAARFTMTGTFKGEFMGMAPTGKQVKMTGAYFYRFKNGKEVEALPFMDSTAMYQQMGVSPPSQ